MKWGEKCLVVLAALVPVTTLAAPLSCEVESLLNGMTAMQRDQGVSRQATAVNANPDGELTKREVKEILDRVYKNQRTRTPDQIKDAVYAACQNRRR